MYYPYFLTYILTGVLISVLVFVWAVKNEQFSDQKRARFLPLEEGEPSGASGPAKGRLEIYGILFLVFVGIGSSFAAIIAALIYHH